MKQKTQPRYFYAFDVTAPESPSCNLAEQRIRGQISDYFVQHQELINRVCVRELGKTFDNDIHYFVILETVKQMEPWIFELFRKTANMHMGSVRIYDSLTYFNYENETLYVRHPTTHPLTVAKRRIMRNLVFG